MSSLSRRTMLQLLALSLAGCQKFNLRSQTPDDDDEIKPKETILIGDQVVVSGLHPIQVESVGLVLGLDGTGGDTSPSLYRTKLLDEMRKRGVKNPNTLLRTPNSALVIVRAAIPPVVQPGDRFDVEVVLPENTEATSLKDGHLLEAAMSEQAIVPGRGPAGGHVLAKADGSVMVSTGEVSDESKAGVLKKGRILGGGVYKGGLLNQGRELGLYVRNDLRSTRQTRRIADAIGRRFHDFDQGIKRPMSKAKTDQFIELKVHSKYKENYIRYVQVVRHIALNESSVERKERIERLRKTLLVPQSASNSALELEAIGTEGVIVLKEGLKSPDPEVRFYSADALAYLGDSSGCRELAAAARNEEAFRVFAYAAMATLDDPTTRELLKDLMSKPTIENENGVEREVWSDETRYGAFRTLWTIDKHDDFIQGESQNGGQYSLHVIKSDGEPLVHLSTHRVCEVALFGHNQKLRTPISISAGRHITITAAAGSETVEISRYQVDHEDRSITTSTDLAEVIRALGKLEASYPDVAQMLVQAQRQSNLPGHLALDALPQAGRFYHRKPAAGGVATTPDASEKTRVGRPNLVPNMFPGAAREEKSDFFDINSSNSGESADSEKSDGAGEATLADVSQGGDDKKPARKRRGLAGLFSRD